MTTPPKPSPEAVAAAAELHPLHDENRSTVIEKAEAQQENEYIDCDRQDTARCIDRHFAPIIAKAELCDRLAAALDTIDSQVRGALNNAQPEEAPDILDHVGNIARVAHREYEATRAAGPAVAGGGRGNA